LELTAEEKEKFRELVALLARHGFGAAGPPRETTFAQIEKFGHQAGRMVARAIDARLAQQHAAYFAGEEHAPRDCRTWRASAAGGLASEGLYRVGWASGISRDPALSQNRTYGSVYGSCFK